MALKRNLFCSSCDSRTLHEEMSYTDLIKLSNEKGVEGVLVKGIAVLSDRYPWAKPFIGFKDNFGNNIVVMQCTVCGSMRGPGDGTINGN